MSHPQAALSHVVAMLAILVACQTEQAVFELGAGQHASATLGPSGSRVYVLPIQRGEVAEVEIEATGIDLEVTTRRGDEKVYKLGYEFAQVLGVNRLRIEQVIVASDDRALRIEVFAPAESPVGRFRIERRAGRQATPDDRIWEEALVAFDQGTVALAAASGRGEITQAHDQFAAAAAAFRRLGRARDAGISQWLEGSTHLLRSDDAAARASFEAAQIELRAGGDLLGAARVDLPLGVIEQRRGNLDEADRHFTLALAAAETADDRDAAGFARNNLGISAEWRGRYGEAERYLLDALRAFQAIDDRNGQHEAHRNLGRLYRRCGDAERALAALQTALAIPSQPNPLVGRARVLHELGLTKAELVGDLEAARKHLTEAVAIERAGGRMLHVARSLIALGGMVASTDVAAAERDAHEALEIAAAGGFAAERAAAQRLLATAVLHSKPDDTIGYAEQALATAIEHGLVPDEVEALRLRALAERATGRNEASERSLEHAITRIEAMRSAIHDVDRRMSWFATVHDVLVGLADLRMSRGRISAGFAASELARARSYLDDLAPGVAPQPALARLRAALGPDTAIVEFLLGELDSWVWIVERAGIRGHRLPSRAVIESAARRWLRALQGSDADDERAAGRELAALVLEPLRETLNQRRRLVVVPDGVLGYVPFAALPTARDGSPLVVSHEVMIAPSASVLATRSPPALPPKPRFLVLADPVYASDDTRMARPIPARGPTLARLGGTRSEAVQIAGLVPEDRVQLALDFAASRVTLFDASARTADIVHVAAHARVDSTGPTGSALLLSALAPDGREVAGRITASEIRGLVLAARLVVLSACQTALGPQIRGEGVTGLARAFHAAGAAVVVASLWDVDDLATAALMRGFYAALIGGATESAALRQAMLEVRDTPRWRAPRWWAAFAVYVTTLE